MNPCTRCGTPTDTSYLLCDPCRHARMVAERAAQGLPPTVTSPAALARVRRVLARALERKAAS